jgi:beta-glucosidase
MSRHSGRRIGRCPSALGDLLGRLTLAEKSALLHQHQPAIPRLGLGPIADG